MGLIGYLFKKQHATELEDPVFGHMVYDYGVWVSVPISAQDGYMVTVTAPESGPTQLQREFFKRIRAKLLAYEERARQFMTPVEDSPIHVEELKTYGLELGPEEEIRRGHFVLELSEADTNLIHRISFDGEKAVDYGLDD